MKRSEHFESEDHYVVTHTADVEQMGMRLDAFLKSRYRKRSRVAIQKAIDEGHISIRRTQGPHLTVGKLKPSTPLIAGDEVLVLSERKPEPAVSFDYKIVHEDEALFVIEKPANLPVHPAGRYFFNTLLVHLKTQGHCTPMKSEREYFLAHRIDKETSGILVLTKDRVTCAHITRQFAERQTEKRYLAIAHGITPEEFEVDLPLARDPHSEISLKMASVPEGEGGQTAHTRFRRLETRGNFSLVECHPRTGRQHQIRVHLQCAGHPIVGDKLYSVPENEALRFYERLNLSPEALAQLILPRHALHSAGLKFRHPLTELPMSFESDLPEDLQAFLEAQGEPNGLIATRTYPTMPFPPSEKGSSAELPYWTCR